MKMTDRALKEMEDLVTERIKVWPGAAQLLADIVEIVRVSYEAGKEAAAPAERATDTLPRAKPQDAKNGWTLDPSWMKDVRDTLIDVHEANASFEVIEAIALHVDGLCRSPAEKAGLPADGSPPDWCCKGAAPAALCRCSVEEGEIARLRIDNARLRDENFLLRRRSQPDTSNEEPRG